MRKSVIIGVSTLVVLLLSGLGVGLYFLLRSDTAAQSAVATSTQECTSAAVGILKKGGSAVDSAITAALCQGLTVPQSSGLGGGFIATVYIKETGTIETLNAREVAPLLASKDMYGNDTSSREGGLAIAVPTELKGLVELHKKYGKLKWEEVVQPVIDVAMNGYKVTKYLADIFGDRGDKIRSKPGFRDIFINPETDAFYNEGDTIINLKLANTFKIIAKEGADAFYGDGSFGKKIVDEIQSAGGIITLEDLQSYQPKWGKPTASKVLDETLYTFPLPSTGNVINFILNVMRGYKVEEHSFEYHQQEKLFYHRLIEAFKFGFAKRTKVGDEASDEVLATLAELNSIEHADYIRSLISDDKTFNDFGHYGANTSVQIDHGTGHLSILASNGDAVALTATVNSIMGAWVMSESTGIVYNNEMNDFSIPKAVSDGLLSAPANFIAPKKSPLSSMSPIIVLNEDKDVSLIIGGAGGILIMTSIVQCLFNYLYLKQSIAQSISAKRLHHQLQPMHIVFESGYDPEILKFFESKGHVLSPEKPAVSGFASVIAISRKNGKIDAATDPRRGGGKVEIF